MQDLTLQQMFGANASQTSETITIDKSDLPALTASINNRGEQLFTAMILQVHQQFEGKLTDEQGRAVTDERGRAITYDNQQLYQKLRLWFWNRHFVKAEEFLIIDTFALEVFITPPTEPGFSLVPDTLNY